MASPPRFPTARSVLGPAVAGDDVDPVEHLAWMEAQETAVAALSGGDAEKVYLTTGDMDADTTQPVLTRAVVIATDLKYYWDGDDWTPALDRLALEALAREAGDAETLAQALAALQARAGLIASGGRLVMGVSGMGGRAGFAALTDGRLLAGGGVHYPVRRVNAPGLVLAYTGSHGRVGFAVLSDGRVLSGERVLSPPALPPSEGALLPHLPADLCAVDGEDMTLYAAGLLASRADAARVRLIATGDGAPLTPGGPPVHAARQGREALTLRPASMGAHASALTLTIRPADDAGGRAGRADLRLRVAPRTGAVSKNILALGDSIMHFGGVSALRGYLSSWGVTATAIGTLGGSPDYGVTGTQGEARPSRALSDYTYATTYLTPVAAGSEAAYLAMTTTDKRARNPMIRSSAFPSADGGAIDPEDVRNGYYLDFRDYITRFSLAEPDALVVQMGTNDITDTPLSSIREHMRGNLMTMARRWHAAYPGRPVIFYMAGASEAAARSSLWPNYVQAIRGVCRAERDARAAGIALTVVPTWALMTTAGGYDNVAPPESLDPDVSARIASTPDVLHPTGAARAQLHHAAAMALAVALRGL